MDSINTTFFAKHFPCTSWACPSLKKAVDADRSTCAKIYSVALRCLFILPILFLCTDLLYSSAKWVAVGLYRCCYPNLNTQQANRPPSASSQGSSNQTANPASDPSNQNDVSNRSPEIQIQTEPPAADPQASSVEGSSEPATSLNIQMAPPPPAADPQVPPAEAAAEPAERLNIQIDLPPPAADPEALPASAEPAEPLNVQVDLPPPAIDPQVPPAEADAEPLNIQMAPPPPAVEPQQGPLVQIANIVLAALPAINAPARPPTPSPAEEGPDVAAIEDPNDSDVEEPLEFPGDEENDFEVVGRPAQERVAEVGPLRARMNQLIFDPANPEKKQKYLYAMHAINKGLTRDCQGWETEFLPNLQREHNASPANAFLTHAYEVFLSISQLDSQEDITVRYTFIVGHLREALKILPAASDSLMMQETRKLLNHVCYLKFTDVHLYPFFENFISQALRASQGDLDRYEIPAFTSATIAEEIRAANHRLKTVPSRYLQTETAKQFKKLQGTVGCLGFDSMGGSNTPWVHSLQTVQTPQGEKTITILRHGTPTVDIKPLGGVAKGLKAVLPSFLGQHIAETPYAEVVPEFLGYLNADPDKNILYVNLQAYKHHSPAVKPGEYARSQAIRRLEEGRVNFHFLALPLDGELWENHTLEVLAVANLKARLKSSLLYQRDGFGLPRQLVGNLNGEIDQLLHQVHRLYFQDRQLNSVKEKKVFIMLFYSELKEYVKSKLDIDLMTTACKDAKDRANASKLVDMAKNLLKLNRLDDPQALRELFFSALAPFIIKNEEIIEERLELALHVIEHLAGLTDAQKQEIQQANAASEFRITAREIPKEKIRPAAMMSQENFLTWLNHLVQTEEEYTIEDPTFGLPVPDVAQLETQIRNELPRMALQINGQKIFRYEDLPPNIDPALLALLSRSAAYRTMKGPVQYLNQNALGYRVSLLAPSQGRTAVQDLITRLQAMNDDEQMESWWRQPSYTTVDYAHYLCNADNQGYLPPGWPVSQRLPARQSVYPTRMNLTLTDDGAHKLQIEQDLVFGERSIVAKAQLESGKTPHISWHFVRPCSDQ